MLLIFYFLSFCIFKYFLLLYFARDLYFCGFVFSCPVMSIKKQKNLKKIVKHLKAHKNYPEKNILIADKSFIMKLNKSYKIAHLDSLLEKPRFFITECEYKKYKIYHKEKNDPKKLENKERKKYKKGRFLEDLIRYFDVKKCSHKELKDDCTSEYIKRKKIKCFVGCEEKIDGYPNCILARGAVDVEYKFENTERNDKIGRREMERLEQIVKEIKE